MNSEELKKELIRTEEILDVYNNNLRILQAQVANFGSNLVPVHIVTSLNEVKDKVLFYQQKIQNLKNQLGISEIDAKSFESLTKNLIQQLDTTINSLQSIPSISTFELLFESLKQQIIDELKLIVLENMSKLLPSNIITKDSISKIKLKYVYTIKNGNVPYNFKLYGKELNNSQDNDSKHIDNSNFHQHSKGELSTDFINSLSPSKTGWHTSGGFFYLISRDDVSIIFMDSVYTTVYRMKAGNEKYIINKVSWSPDGNTIYVYMKEKGKRLDLFVQIWSL